jgi:hypothetical protein
MQKRTGEADDMWRTIFPDVAKKAEKGEEIVCPIPFFQHLIFSQTQTSQKLENRDTQDI